MNLLAQYLFDQKTTQAEFASRVGCHPSRISHLVNGEKPTPEMAMSIETATGGQLRCEQLCDSVVWKRDRTGQLTGYFVPAEKAA